jgi:diguanylate cyclase (GGDEF)-like protein
MKRGGRIRLRSRVLLLTAAFACALFAITFGLSWRAHQAQKRWSRLVGVETRAIAVFEEVIRAQNAYRVHAVAGDASHYDIVTQLLGDESLAEIDTSALRRRMSTFRMVLADTGSTPQEIAIESGRVATEAQKLIDARKREIAQQLPLLDREAREMMSAGLAIAWILVISSFAAVQITLRKVVRPLEDLAGAADLIAKGDLNARAPVGGDREIADLGVAFNRMADELRARARTDELTGLPNFRAFRERLDEEIARASRYPERFGILVLDLDRFKKYNDSFGHLAGNDALQRVSHVLRDAVRTVDFAARYGGEEFAVIVPRIDGAALHAIAERIRAGVEALPAPADGSNVTVSIGGALYPDDAPDVDALFTVADERLYEAKRLGRNRVVTPAAEQRGNRTA